MAGNWNRSIELARAPFITYCHDDDALLPGALERLMTLQKKSKDKAVFSACHKINAKGEIIAKHTHPKTKWGILVAKDHYNITLTDCFISNYGSPGGCLFSKQNMIELGGYNEDFCCLDVAIGVLSTYKYGAVYNDVPVLNQRVAVNTSFAVIEQIPLSYRDIQNCIKNKLPYPNFILNLIINARFDFSKKLTLVGLGLADQATLRNVSLIDRLIVKACWSALIPTRYKFKSLF
jgi:glycosyltransferase involved in cell wall biosynthesis